MAGHCLGRDLNLALMVESPVSFSCYAKTTSRKVKQRSSMACFPHIQPRKPIGRQMV